MNNTRKIERLMAIKRSIIECADDTIFLADTNDTVCSAIDDVIIALNKDAGLFNEKELEELLESQYKL